MDSLITTFQLLLLLPALATVGVSWRTSRRRRSRHHGLVAVASLVGAASLLLTMFSLAMMANSEEPVDPGPGLLAPLCTIALSAWVVYRGLTRSRGNPSR
jgi:hypothetical protein